MLAGFFLLPAIVRYKLPPMIRDATGRDSSIAAAAFDPLRLRLQLQGFELKEKNGQAFLKCAELYADFDVWRSLRHGALSFAKIRLAQPEVQIARQKNGVFNYADLWSDTEQEGGILPFEIAQLQLLGGDVRWRDAYYAQPVDEAMHPLDIEINGLSARQDAQSPFSISLALKSGTKLAWSGTFGLDPLRSEGRLQIKELHTRQIGETFLQGNTAITLNKGVNGIDSRYRLEYTGGQLNIELTPLQIAVNAFVLSERGDPAPLIDLQALRLHDARLEVKWSQAGGEWQVKLPEGALEVEKFALSDPGAQRQRLEIEAFALQGLTLDLVYKDRWQINAGHQKVEVKNSSFALNNQRPLKISAAAVSVGPVRFAATQAKPGSALALNAAQDSLKVQKLTLALPATRETLLDVAEVAVGKLRFDLQPRDNAAPQIQVSQDSFAAKQFSLRESGQSEPLAAVASASVDGVQFDLDKKLVKIASAASSGADIKAWLESDGTFNYQALFAAKNLQTPQPQPAVDPGPEAGKTAAQPPETSSARQPDEPGSPWTLAVGKLALDNGAIGFQDRSRKPPAAFKLAAISTGVENFNSADGAKFPLRFSALFNDSGTIKLSGSAALQPFSTALDIDVAQFPLKPFQSYVSQFARLDVLGGTLHIGGKLALDLSIPKQPRASFRGGTGISQFHSREQLTHKDFAKWEQLALQGVVFDLQPLRFDAAEILVEQPYLRVAVGKERTVNLADIAVKQSQSAPAPVPRSPAGSKSGPGIAFNIKKVKLRQGHTDFSDQSLIVPFAAHIDHLDGVLKGLSSESDSEASLSLQGKVLDLAPVEIDGAFKPYQGESKITLSFRGLPLTSATPYMAEFAGYKIEKGQMSLDLNYAIAKGQLNASNKILLDQLTLGEKVASPRAVSLPLELAVALLKDAQGKINIDFPIRGSLEDPQFSIGALVADALLNVISKTVTSPFRAIAALLGGTDEDLGHIDFADGSADLAETEIEKLNGLAKVFAERKELRLEVKGTAYQQQDWPPLTADALREQLRDNRVKELREKGENPAAEDVELSEKEYRRLLADLFIAKFPHLAKYSLFGTPKLVDDDKSDFYAVAENKLRAAMQPDRQKLRDLAAQRAEAIARYLIRQKGIDNGRVFILDAKIEPDVSEQGVAVELSLQGS